MGVLLDSHKILELFVLGQSGQVPACIKLIKISKLVAIAVACKTSPHNFGASETNQVLAPASVSQFCSTDN